MPAGIARFVPFLSSSSQTKQSVDLNSEAKQLREFQAKFGKIHSEIELAQRNPKYDDSKKIEKMQEGQKKLTELSREINDTKTKSMSKLSEGGWNNLDNLQKGITKEADKIASAVQAKAPSPRTMSR